MVSVVQIFFFVMRTAFLTIHWDILVPRIMIEIFLGQFGVIVVVRVKSQDYVGSQCVYKTIVKLMTI
jgi:hypothetical protein